MSQTSLVLENLDKQSELINSERRQEVRQIVNDLPIEITGIDSRGHLFTERALVRDVTERGCRFDIRIPVRCGDILVLKPLLPGEKVLSDEHSQLFDVMWTANHGSSCTVGARILQGEKLENVKFPPPNYSPRRPAK